MVYHSLILILGDTAPELPQSVNPLLQTSPRQSPTHDAAPSGAQQVMEDEGGEDGEDEPEGRGSSAMVVMPWPGRVPGLPGMPSIAPGRPAVGIKEDWVAFFDKVLNRDSSEPDDPSSSNPRKRIIFLESPEAMSATFDVWWPSLVEAVRRRRRGAHLSDFALPQKKGSKQKAAPPHTLSHPTTIILGSAPSLLLPHTSSVAPFPSTQPSGTGQHPIHPMLQEIAERFGGVVEAKEVGSDAPPLWWGSEEFDQIGRMQREQKRLSALVEDDKG